MAIKQFDSELVSRVSSIVSESKPIETDTTLSKGLAAQVKSVLGGLINEEKDPEDNKTGNLFPAEHDQPDLHTVHHRVDAVTSTMDGKVLSRHTIGTTVHKRDANESAEAFGNRVMKHVENGHEAAFDGDEGKLDHFTPFSPFTSFSEMEEEHGKGAGGWMHAGSSHPITHTHGNGTIVHNFDHYLKVVK